jgi:lipopolysaccharide transport system permease protein
LPAVERTTPAEEMIDAAPVDRPTMVIGGDASSSQYWLEAWRHRELMYFLALRDVLVRYKQTAIGVSWSVLRPFLTMLALTWVFGRGAGLRTPDERIPYALWVFVATLPWQFFADGVTAASNCMVQNASMVSKVYFPRMLLPMGRILVSFVDFSVAFALLGLLMMGFHLSPYHFVPSWRMIFLPLFLLAAFGVTAGAGLLFGALNVKYRDFSLIVPFVVTFGLYLSPVGLSSADFTRGDPLFRTLFSINPMVGVIDGFRWAVFGPEAAPMFLPGMAASFLSLALLVALGVGYFRATESDFADFI